MGTGVAGGLSSIALAVPCIGAGSFSNKNSEEETDRRIVVGRVSPTFNGTNVDK